MITLEARGILFDNDGVLVDSHGPAAIAWNLWAGTWAPEFDFFRDMPHGTRATDIIADLVAESDRAAAEAELERREIDTASATTPIDGAIALTRSLPPGTWTVVTSALRPLAIARLTAAGINPPARIVSGDDVRRGKPDSEPYLAGAALLGLEPTACIALEDAAAGIAAARAAGIGTVIGVGTAAVTAKPDLLVNDLRQLRWEGNTLILTEG